MIQQEKTGKIIVREKKKKSLMMAEGYKGLGVVNLDLHDIATAYQPFERAAKLEQCQVAGAVIEFVIVPKIIGEADAMFDETMSNMSGLSDIQAADFGDTTSSKVILDKLFYL